MNKQLHHRLRQAGFAVLVMAALVAVDGGQMDKAKAGIRIHARLETPHVSVQYQNGPRQARVHRPFFYRITNRDRVIARRLARETGHRRDILLDLRSRGMSWRQIGLRLDIPRQVMRFAIHSGPDRHFRGKHGHKRCGTGRR